MRSSGGKCGCYGHRFGAGKRLCVTGEDGCEGQILSVGNFHDQAFLNTTPICTRVDVTDAKAVEKATQDAVKEFGSISGWYDTCRVQGLGVV